MIWRKYHKTKSCCLPTNSRLPLESFQMNKQDRRIYRRFLNFLTGKYSLEKEETAKEEEDKEEEKGEPRKGKPLNYATELREKVNKALQS